MHRIFIAALCTVAVPAMAQEPKTTRPPACQYDRATAIATESIALATMGQRELALLHLSQLDRVAETIRKAGMKVPETEVSQ